MSPIYDISKSHETSRGKRCHLKAMRECCYVVCVYGSITWMHIQRQGRKNKPDTNEERTSQRMGRDQKIRPFAKVIMRSSRAI